MSTSRSDARPWPFWQPLIAILLASFFIRVFDVDRKVAALSYDSVNHRWPFDGTEPWRSIYRYAIFPPLILGLVGIVAALFGHWFGSVNRSLNSTSIRRDGLFLALMLLVGPGLVVESGLKSYWGRPRPSQCRDFGGEMTFAPLGTWGTQRFINSSFPSGHAAVAFYLMSLGFIVSLRHPRLRRACLMIGIGYGSIMGFARMLQGGHFFSDILWAGAIVYFVGVGLERLMIRPGELESCQSVAVDQITRP